MCLLVATISARGTATTCCTPKGAGNAQCRTGARRGNGVNRPSATMKRRTVLGFAVLRVPAVGCQQSSAMPTSLRSTDRAPRLLSAARRSASPPCNATAGITTDPRCRASSWCLANGWRTEGCFAVRSKQWIPARRAASMAAGAVDDGGGSAQRLIERVRVVTRGSPPLPARSRTMSRGQRRRTAGSAPQQPAAAGF